MTGTPPHDCSWCGLERQGHARQWAPGGGWHAWVPPSQEQIKARMIARRAERNPR
ncbi:MULTISPECIES: hypothetical protein [Streptomyces]|uniref:hypothetical protein n=1 Tax=Streptomyces TaxID=1883 RepID=UPI00345BD95D